METLMRKMVVACACALVYVCTGIARAEEAPSPEVQMNTQQPSGPAAPAVDPAEERADAWKEALEESLGLTPEEVSAYKSGKTALEAAGKPRETPAVAESAAVTVSMQPGAASPKVTLLHGFVTAIEILDATGQPWPVVSVTQGDPTAVDVKVQGAAQSFTRPASAPSTPTFGVVVPGAAVDEDVANVTAPAPMPSSAGNVITVNPLTKFSATNIVVVLAGASRPISLLLTPIEATPETPLQDRITLLVDGEGPNARIEPVRSYADLDAGPDLRNVLVGQPPTASAVEIIAELPSGVRAWRDGGVLWVRTPDRVISPAPMAHVAMGNMRAYRMTYLPVIVVAKGGRTEQFSVSN